MNNKQYHYRNTAYGDISAIPQDIYPASNLTPDDDGICEVVDYQNKPAVGRLLRPWADGTIEIRTVGTGANRAETPGILRTVRLQEGVPFAIAFTAIKLGAYAAADLEICL